MRMNFPGGWQFSRDAGGIVHVVKTVSDKDGEIVAAIGLTPEQWDELVSALALSKPAAPYEIEPTAEGPDGAVDLPTDTEPAAEADPAQPEPPAAESTPASRRKTARRHKLRRRKLRTPAPAAPSV